MVLPAHKTRIRVGVLALVAQVGALLSFGGSPAEAGYIHTPCYTFINSGWLPQGINQVIALSSAINDDCAAVGARATGNAGSHKTVYSKWAWDASYAQAVVSSPGGHPIGGLHMACSKRGCSPTVPS